MSRTYEIQKLQNQLTDLQSRVSKIKEYRKENDPEKLEKEIEEYKLKIKEQEKQIAEIKEIEDKRRFKQIPVITDAIFSFPEGANVELGVKRV